MVESRTFCKERRKVVNNPVLIWGPRDEVTVPKADRMSVAEPKIAARFLVPTP